MSRSNAEIIERFITRSVLTHRADQVRIEWEAGRERELVEVMDVSEELELDELATDLALSLEDNAVGRPGQRTQHYRLIAIREGKETRSSCRVKVEAHDHPDRMIEPPNTTGIVGQLMRHLEQRESNQESMLRATVGSFETVLRHVQQSHEYMAERCLNAESQLATYRVREETLSQRERALASGERVEQAKATAIAATGAQLARHAPMIIGRVAAHFDRKLGTPALPAELEDDFDDELHDDHHTDEPDDRLEPGAPISLPAEANGHGEVDATGPEGREAEPPIVSGPAGGPTDVSGSPAPTPPEAMPTEMTMFLSTFTAEQMKQLVPLLGDMQRTLFVGAWQEATGQSLE